MKFNNVFRILLGLSSLLVIACLFLPLWEIYLWAPQYPEGLSIQIWHNDLKGDVDIINGLNHYIGMKHIKVEMFPEFMFLKYILIAFVLYGLFVAINGSVKWLKIFCASSALGGVIALADFYRWGYDYGHNLDPTAPIQVPGMAYQPPVIGYKDLLNFKALSMPSEGGWIIISVGIIAFMALGFTWFKQKKMKTMNLLLLPLLAGLLSSCNQSTPQINFGSDDCTFCKMKIMDNKFGLILQTPKGRTLNFDDYHCYKNYVNENKPEIKETFVVVFDKPGEILPASQASFIAGESVKSPMGSGVAFFLNQQNAGLNFPNESHQGTFEQLIHE
jgi:copper chaperone NosL